MCYDDGVSKRSDDDLAHAWRELMGRYHRVTCVLDRALQSEHGISASEFAVLEQLAESRPDNSLRMHELGENAHVSQSALSRLVARLENDGLVNRNMCTEDRRSVWVCLTAAGVDTYRSARPTQREVLRTEGAVAAAL
jgi:DNA-binding MarR family transcriptional regulator